jgi:hypothetical protein
VHAPLVVEGEQVVGGGADLDEPDHGSPRGRRIPWGQRPDIAPSRCNSTR